MFFRREFYVVEARSAVNPTGPARVSNWHEAQALRKLFQRTGLRVHRTYGGSMHLVDSATGEVLIVRNFEVFSEVAAARLAFDKTDALLSSESAVGVHAAHRVYLWASDAMSKRGASDRLYTSGDGRVLSVTGYDRILRQMAIAPRFA